jgi:DNA-binding transcriptional ArsR family regulator
MGTLGDNLFGHPGLWASVDDLVAYVRSIPLGEEGSEVSPGIQLLIHQATFRYQDEFDPTPYQGLPIREAVERRMESLDDRDATAIMAMYDRPEELRERIARLIERFYAEHYRNEMPRRIPRLERSVSAHRQETMKNPSELAAKLTSKSCTDAGCTGPSVAHIFAPSLDMGPYTSCVIIDGLHGQFYQLEPEFRGAAPEDAEEARLAQVYKALGDEQRLRILRMLREREMYAQEIVERTGLHQSVVSRHLSFMKAVGLLRARKQNNMKFFSLNPDAREILSTTLALFEAARAV